VELAWIKGLSLLSRVYGRTELTFSMHREERPTQSKESPDDAAGPKKSKIKNNCYLNNTANHLYWEIVFDMYSSISSHWKFDIPWGVYLGHLLLGEGRLKGGHRFNHSKEWRWFPIGCPLWPLHYLWPFGYNLPLNVCDAQINGGGLLWVKILVCSLGVGPWCWRLQTSNTPG